MIKTLMFDMGGVVIRTDFDALYATFAARLRIPADFVRHYCDKHFADLTIGQATWRHLQKDMGKAVGRKLPNFDMIWVEEGLRARTNNEPLLATIARLRKHYKVGAASNLHDGRWLIDKKTKIYSHFDYTVLSCRDQLKKPDPEFYHLALSRASAKPDEAILVDDKAEYIIGAKDFGLHAITFTDNAHLVESLKQFGVGV